MFVKTEDRLLANMAAAATIAGGVLHLLMIGPYLKPSNFPMELLLYGHLFIVAGLAQIFWALPMIKGWGLHWYYLGIFGTAASSLSLLLTRVPNGITSTALIDTNPMALNGDITISIHRGYEQMLEELISGKQEKCDQYIGIEVKTRAIHLHHTSNMADEGILSRLGGLIVNRKLIAILVRVLKLVSRSQMLNNGY